jgi:uncharacterized protein Smg (DUF494 family)
LVYRDLAMKMAKFCCYFNPELKLDNREVVLRRVFERANDRIKISNWKCIIVQVFLSTKRVQSRVNQLKRIRSRFLWRSPRYLPSAEISGTVSSA